MLQPFYAQAEKDKERYKKEEAAYEPPLQFLTPKFCIQTQNAEALTD